MIMKKDMEQFVFLDIPLFLLSINYLFYNAFGMYSLKTLFRVSAILVLLLGVILKSNFEFNIKGSLAMCLTIVSVMLNGRMALNFCVFILFGVCVSYSLETIIKSAFKINGILVLIMVSLMLLHITDNTSYVSSMGRLRYNLGFHNPNVAALFYSSALYLLLVSRRKINWLVICFSTIMTVIIYLYTDSRTPLLASIAYIALESLFLVFNKKNMNKAIRLLGNGSIFLVDTLFLLNLISVFIIDKFMIFDELVSFRVSTFLSMINSSGVKCFLFGGTFDTVDNFYYMLLFQYGVFIYIFVAVSTHLAMYKMVTNGNYKYISMLVGLFLVAMMESSLIRPEILIVLVVWRIIMSDDKELLPDSCELREALV